MRIVAIVALSAFLSSCGVSSTPPPAGAPAPAPAAVEVPAQKSEIMARADALVEDMRRRQAAQEKRDRENPPPPPPTLPTFQPAPQPAAQPIAAPTYAPPPSAPIAAPAAPADARGEQWWKEQARTLQDRVEDETRKMNAARAAMLNSTLRITADEAEREYLALVASVRNAQAALDRHRDDARRAGVPAGWARWP